MLKKKSFNISDLRREYTRDKLSKENLTAEPMNLFENWLKQAIELGISDSTAMCMATVDNLGIPYQRLVLLKSFTTNNIIFYTNLKSRKALQLLNNSNTSFNIFWSVLERQVTIQGIAERLSLKEDKDYFYSRPKESQISVWVSHQSNTIPNRTYLEEKFLKMIEIYSKEPVPFPNFWGGFRVNIQSVEFWQGRKYRLHDRFIYKINKNNLWSITRLAP
ncbi:pyridoxamine 5'-phosphate oxidase [Candidatus Schneideria nysicola]|uniref:pyridoxamine 5'-phosphate oxidase n=1 Tax=Candidatus Schneideria nysicola TaxID=1081631 RepID=UPI001CAA754D|nr:pyridoxamine 5'-phosphate oxidase [Candidatus Schneideria nysicola]UAJ65546.1 pyridoxamine 5'-phosphate oxidase [Candidatus Schneideria nysicola]